MGRSEDVDDAFEGWLEDLVAWAAPHLPEGPRFDSHVHLGIDAGSGHEVTLSQLDRHMSLAGVERALLIPLNASDGYRRTNARFAELCSDDHRFDFLGRIDPNAGDPSADARSALDAGAVGIKLHPHSDAFAIDDPRLDATLGLVAGRQGLVLVHTGIDVDRAALDTLDRAAALPDATFVLGHLPVESLWQTVLRMRELPNVFISTAWWGPYDLALAYGWLPAERFLLGSDPPYGSIPLGVVLAGLVGRSSGLDDGELTAVLGGTLTDLLTGRRPDPSPARLADREVPPDRDPLARTPIAFRRCYQYLIAAGANVARGGDDASHARMAANCLEPGAVDSSRLELADRIRESIELGVRLTQDGRAAAAYAVYAGALTMALAGSRL